MCRRRARSHPWYRVHKFLNVLYGFGGNSLWAWVRVLVRTADGFLIGLLALVPFCDPASQRVPQALSEVLQGVNKNRFTIAACLIVAQLVFRFVGWMLQRCQPFREIDLKGVLEFLVRRHFRERDRTDHHYRATLFKVRRCPVVGAWLGIVARSGERYSQKGTVFSIHANRMEYNTGIAGECWRQEGQTLIQELPNARDAHHDSNALLQYGERGYTCDRELRSIQVRAVVFLATGIRVKGHLWGVLVLDTTDPAKAPRQEQRHRNDLEFAAIAISSLVGRPRKI